MRSIYSDILRQLREDVAEAATDKWCTNDWLLHLDNVPVHTTVAVQQFLASKNMTIIPHPLSCLIQPVTSSSSPR